jgi:glycolate oxidase iron-sulfur subunit
VIDLRPLGEDAELRDGALRCVRCSICVPRCPSYAVFKTEADSPRGRVQLMRAAIEGRVAVDASFEQRMDNCLGCRACEDACPSAVPFGYMIDRVRQELQASPRGRLRKWLVRAGLEHIVSRPLVVLWLARLLRVIQWLRLDRLARRIAAPLSPTAGLRIDQLPRVEGAPFDQHAAASDPDATAQFLSGCIMAGALGDAQRASLRVLRRSGWAVAVPKEQVCCGALHQHAGHLAQARELARQNIDAFEGGRGPIAVSSAGCGLAMKEYGRLLADDPAYAARAAAFSARVRDLLECLPPDGERGGLPARAARRPLRVAVQEACHHWNVQRLRGRVAPLLEAHDAGTITTLPTGAGCCGSAGLFSALRPEPAAQLLGKLLNAVEASGCDVVVSANPGCLLFMRSGLRARRSRIRALHVAQLLDLEDESEPGEA